MQETRKTFLELVQNNIEYGFQTYRDFVFGLLVGLFVAWMYHRFLGSYSLRKSYEERLAGKNETIDAYRALLNERLSKMDTPQYDKALFKRLKQFFRKSIK